MKSVAITGHTQGLGLALQTELQNRGWHVSGFSRSNGYDLCTIEGMNRAIESICTADIFINNARIGFAQVQMLERVYSTWSSEPKERHIINIGSLGAFDPLARDSKNRDYIESKIALRELSTSLALFQSKNSSLKVTCINPGYFDSPRIIQRNLNEPIMKTNDLVDIILWILAQPRNLLVAEMTVASIIDHHAGPENFVE